jgi:hypothetical protein
MRSQQVTTMRHAVRRSDCPGYPSLAAGPFFYFAEVEMCERPCQTRVVRTMLQAS